MNDSERLEALRGLLHGPVSWKTWGEVVALMSAWPAGEGRDAGLDYLHGGLAGWFEGVEASSDAPLAGLWRLKGLSRSEGHIDRDEVEDWHDVNQLMMAHMSERDTSYSFNRLPEAWFLLEIRADGRFREVDLSRHPLVPLGKRKPIEPVGMVYRDGGGGFEHSFRPDADGLQRCHEPASLAGAERMILTRNTPDEFVHDVFRIKDSGGGARMAFLVWDGYYTTDVSASYVRLSGDLGG